MAHRRRSSLHRLRSALGSPHPGTARGGRPARARARGGGGTAAAGPRLRIVTRRASGGWEVGSNPAIGRRTRHSAPACARARGAAAPARRAPAPLTPRTRNGHALPDPRAVPSTANDCCFLTLKRGTSTASRPVRTTRLRRGKTAVLRLATHFPLPSTPDGQAPETGARASLPQAVRSRCRSCGCPAAT